MAYPYSHQNYPPQPGQNIVGPSGDIQSQQDQTNLNLGTTFSQHHNGTTFQGYSQQHYGPPPTSINGELNAPPQATGQKGHPGYSFYGGSSHVAPRSSSQGLGPPAGPGQFVGGANASAASQRFSQPMVTQPPAVSPPISDTVTQSSYNHSTRYPPPSSSYTGVLNGPPPLGASGSPQQDLKPALQPHMKSMTPPPLHAPHPQTIHGQNLSSARSTPTHSIPPPPATGIPRNDTPQHLANFSQPPPPMMNNPSASASITQQQGGIAPPPLPGQQYHPPSKDLAPPPLPGQQYASQASSHPSMLNQPNKSYASAVAYPPGLNPPGPSPSNAGSMTSQNIQPPPPAPNQAPGMPGLSNDMSRMNISNAKKPINLLQESRILPFQKPVETPLRFETTTDRNFLIPPDRKNCHPDVLRCTLKAIPHTQNLLQKVKLPLGLVVHPFKDLSSLPVISAGIIVRCKRCRTYVNPFVSFIDERRWRCNMCFSVNDVPEEFLHHPVTKTYGEPHTRPECTNSTIEFIAPQEYMLRPPQPAVYLFLMDVSHSAIETGYLQIVCDALLDHLDRLPGDSRTQIGFLTYNQTVHFYRLNEGLAQPQMLIVSDIDDIFVPTPENLLVNLKESKGLVQELLHQLPLIHNLDVVGEVDTYSALGAALDVAKKLMVLPPEQVDCLASVVNKQCLSRIRPVRESNQSAVGGRVTVFQQSLPSIGPGKLESREDPNLRAGEVSASSLNPATDFYKKMALDCSGHQIAVDFFFFNSHYIDIATLSCSSRFSAGDVHYYPSLHTIHNPMEAERLARDLERYLTRKIGFESVMRIRCTKGLNIHTFHGNFFVRSTDLLALANVNPDAGYAVNLSIEDPLTDLSAVCFQAALLYTTSKGERRIRVHTMCVPVVKTPADVLNAVDSVAVTSLLSKMGVDRSITATISDARDALINAVIDPLKAYKETLPPGMTSGGGVYVPPSMRLFPLYIHCMLKHVAFRTGISTKLDDRVFAMVNFKMQPASYFLQDIHPDLYRVDDLNDEGCIQVASRDVPQPNILPLSAESLSQSGTFLLDCGWWMYLLVGRSTNQAFIRDVLGYPQFSNIEEPMYGIPEQENPASELFQSFVEWLQDQRPHHASLRVIRDDSRERILFLSHLRQDRYDSTKSLQDFLLHIQQKLN